MLAEKGSDKSLIFVIISDMIRKGRPPTIQLTTPLPPGINTQYATVEGRRVLSEVARKWKKEVGRQIQLLEDKGVLTERISEELRHCYLSIFLEFYFTSPHRRDLDGGLKIALDAVCAALNLNDNRVVDIHLVKKIDPLHPRLELTMEGLTEWEFDEQYEVYLPEADQ